MAKSADAVTVCLVEHHPAVRFYLAALLEREGFRVPATFPTAEAALCGIPRHRPRLAVVDNRLPDGSGVDLCRELRRVCPWTLLILHNSTLSIEEQTEAEDAGVSAIVMKSLDLGELFRTMWKLHQER